MNRFIAIRTAALALWMAVSLGCGGIDENSGASAALVGEGKADLVGNRGFHHACSYDYQCSDDVQLVCRPVWIKGTGYEDRCERRSMTYGECSKDNHCLGTMYCEGGSASALGGNEAVGQCMVPGDPPEIPGWVTWMSTMKPAAGVVVVLHGFGPSFDSRLDELYRTVTNKNGEYSLPPLPDGSYYIEVFFGGKLLSTNNLDVPSPTWDACGFYI